MTLQAAHKVADENSPEYVSIPETWGGLLVWAAGKWGVGIVFAAMLVPVYSDLKASNQRLADISKANVEVLTALAQDVKTGNERTSRLEEAIRRLDDHIVDP